MDIKYRLRYLSVLGALFFSTAFMVRPSYSAALQKSEPESEKSGAKSGEAKSNEIPGAPRIALDQIEGSPGASLMIPLYYTPGKNEPLRALAVDIEYVSNHLKFQKAAEGVIPEGVKVNISTNVTDGAPDSKGTVRSKLHISVSEDKSATKPLPEALLTYLLFQ